MRFRRTLVQTTVLVFLVAAVTAQRGGSPLMRGDLDRLRFQIPGRDLSANPPRLLDASIEPLRAPDPRGNVVLRVRFDPDERLPPRIQYRTDGRIFTLADDGTGPDARAGDGIYTAVGPIEIDAFRRAITRMAESRTSQPASVFRRRSKGTSAARLEPADFRPGGRFRWEPWGDPPVVDVGRTLMVTAPGVVQDPTRTRAACDQTSMGKWSFGYLMEQMANTPVTGVTGSELALEWLERWTSNQVVNTWTINSRPLMQERIIDPWVAASGGPGSPLDLSRAPFRLLAIVNRVDLRSQVAYGGGNAGELRFVFGAMNSETCNVLPEFLVIFEYGVPISGCLGLKIWANQWKDLEQHALGSPGYNAALEAITEQVVVSNANPLKPNGSALNQLRTNENAIDPVGGIDWEVREFKISTLSHHLVMVTVKQTPASIIRFQSVLGQYVNSHLNSIHAGTHIVPLQFPFGTPFRGGADVYGFSSLWDRTSSPDAIADREARHLFALQTCSGCHRRETDTLFTHVGVAPWGGNVTLSNFLTGGFVNDPADGMPMRYFNDLERRATDLDALLATPCFMMSLDFPLKMVH